MAEIIEARVKQKTGTEADFAGFELLEGEIALVKETPGGPVTNFKVGPGLFDTLPYSLDFADLIVKGIAEPSTDPAPATTGDSWFAGIGTFINFLDGGGVAITTTENLNILTYNGTSWDVLAIPISVDLSAYATREEVDPAINLLNDVLSPQDVNRAASNISIGWISTSDGHLVTVGENANAANYRTTEFIRVNDISTVHRINVNLSNYNSDIAIFSFFGQNQNFIGHYSPSPALSDMTITISDHFTGVYYIRVTALQNAGQPFEVYANVMIKEESIQGMATTIQRVSENETDIVNLTSEINNLYTYVDYAQKTLLDGYISTSGSFVSNVLYYSTDFIPVKEGQRLIYTGLTGSLVVPIAGYGPGKAFVQPLLSFGDYNDEEVIVPSGVSFVKFSARHDVGDVYSFRVPELTSTPEVPDVPHFMPAVSYAKEGDLFRIYPFGVIAKNIKDYSVDIRWGQENGCRDFFELTPSGSDNDIAVELLSRDVLGENKSMGSTIIKVTHTVVSPASNINIICLGDSLTLGVNSIEGAWVNEFSRRLTGVGTAQGDVQPAALALSNIYFRGTLGDQPVKHEGRGGWSANRYLSVAAVGEVTNAFWDGSAFSLNYYLTQNNFQAAQTAGGVDATGSNLVLYILLGWNDIRLYGATDAAAYIGQLVDNIHASHPDATIKLLGLNPPPESIMRADKENWSPELVMRDFVIAGAMAWQAVADARAWVEFVPVAPFFSPYKAYDTVAKLINSRVTDEKTYCRDNVHPVANGYAQIADVAYYNFLYNFCQ